MEGSREGSNVEGRKCLDSVLEQNRRSHWLERTEAKDNGRCKQLSSRAHVKEMLRLRKILEESLFRLFQWIYSKILGVLYDGTPRAIPSTKNSMLLESASCLASRIRNQKVTSFEVVKAYVNRIQEINGVLNCVVDARFEEALAEAKKADELIRSGTKTAEELEREAPFLGVPFSVPECLGVRGLRGAEADGGVVRGMRGGGAIPLACTNVSEQCFPRETHNPVFGRTANPYDTRRSAGGPFGGEGCLVASSGCPLGVAPSAALASAFNGVFGHKPSATCGSGSAGPLSRCSADLLPALRLLAKHSEVQLKLDEPVDVKKLKYYYTDGEYGSPLTSPVNEEIKEALKKAVDHFRNFHQASVERIDPKELTKAFPFCEINVDAALNKDGGKVDLRKEMVKALFGKSQHTFIFLLTSLVAGKTRSQTNIIENRAQLLSKFQALLGSDAVLLCPAHPTPAFRHNESVARIFDFCHAELPEVLGLPATYCPGGLTSEGLPVGLQVVAGMDQDRLTLAVAREIEKVLEGWKPPPTSGCFTLKNTVFHNLFNEKVKIL